jgi:hypothetical protein
VPTWDRGDFGPLCNPRVAPPTNKQPTRAADGEFREAPNLTRWLQVSLRRKLSVPTWGTAFFAALRLGSTTTWLKMPHARPRVRELSKNRRPVDRNCPWEVMRHVTHVRCRTLVALLSTSKHKCGI